MKSLAVQVVLVMMGVVFVLLSPSPVAAQAYFQEFGTYPWSVPLPVTSGYVDAANGNLHIEIPVASIGERGHVPFVAKLVYDSHVWQKVTASGSTSWQPTNVASLPITWGGWRLITSAGNGSGVTYKVGTATCEERVGNEEIPDPYVIYDDFAWTAPDGHAVPFSVLTTPANNSCTSPISTAYALARDGSGYHMSITNYYDAIVYAADGTQVYPNVKDTNGNYYSAPNSNGDVTDTRGQMPVTTTVNGGQIAYAVKSSEGSYQIVVNTGTIAVNTLFGVTGITEYSGNITVVNSIQLPDSTTYQFAYDSGATGTHFGTLTSMTLPTTGIVTYQSHNIFKDAYGNPYLYTEGYSAAGGQWSFTPSVLATCGSTCSQEVTVTQPNGDQELYTFTMYDESMWNTQAASYTGSVAPANLLQSTAIGYNTSNPPYIQPTSYQTTVPVPSGNLMSQVTLTYDTNNFGNVINQNEWNFYPGTLPSSPDRIYTYTYLPNTADENMVNKREQTTLTRGTTTYSNVVVTYDSYGSGGLTTISNVFGHDDTNFGSTYTARGNPTFISSGGIGIVTLHYDTTGQVLAAFDPVHTVATAYSYSDCYMNDALPPTTYSPSAATNAFPTKVTLSNYHVINLCYYWGSGKLASTTDQNGATTAYHFIDSMDRQTHVVPPTGWTEWAYTNETEVDAYTGIGTTAPTTSCSSPGSCRHDAAYLDSFARFSYSQLINDPDGTTTTSVFTYDANSRIQTSANPYRSASDPTYGVETPTYDGLNRVIQVQHADSNVAKVYYGAKVSQVTGANTTQLCATTYGYGYPTMYIDEAGKMKETWTDGFGRVIEVDEPNTAGTLNSNTCYEYDPANNLEGVAHTTSSGTQYRTYTYDQLSRLVNTYSPETGQIGYSYTNSVGNLCSGIATEVCSRTDARSVTATYNYDTLNRLASISYSDGVTPAVYYCYDGTNSSCGVSNTSSNVMGRLSAMKDGSGSTIWNYDTDGRVVSEQRTIGTISKTISYAYNGDGTLSSITYPSGRKVNYVVGNAERAQSATDATGTQYAVTASYAAAGPLSAVIYGKVTSGFSGFNASQGFDKRWDLTSILATSTAGTAINLGYCFYALVSGACPTTGSNNNGTVGVMTNNKDTGRTETFAYDPLNRITSATTQATSGADCWGQSFTTDALSNMYTITSTQTGCMVGALSATVTGTTNQLGFTAPPQPAYDKSGNTTADGTYTYTFDAENRITATSASAITYIYDGNGRRVEKSGTTLYWRAITGEVLAETDTSGNTKNEYVYFAGQRIAWWDGATPQQNLYYVYSDALGSTRTIAKANGTVCYDSEYTPYGQELNHTSACPSTYNYKFTGYERDSETGLDYAFARYYSSRLGRFMSPDPLGGSIFNPQTLNRYAYVANSPTNMTDPLGLYCYVGEGCNQENEGGWAGSSVYDVYTSWSGVFSWGYAFSGTLTVTSTVYNVIGLSGGPFPDGELGAESDGLSSTQTFTLADVSGDVGAIPLGGSIGGGTSSGTTGGAGALGTRLRKALSNKECASLLGGSSIASQILNQFNGTVNVDSPTANTNAPGFAAGQAQVAAGATASTPVPNGGNFTNGQWSGPNFSTFVGNTFANYDVSVQATIEIHEFMHAASDGSLIATGLIDLTNPLPSGNRTVGGQTMNIYAIAAKCGTMLPPNF